MKARNILALFVALLLLYTVIVTATGVGERKYTHKELMAMPPLELYNLFRENGLVIHEGLQRIPDEQMAERFYISFEFFLQGDAAYGHSGYFDMMKAVIKIYPSLVNEEDYYKHYRRFCKEEIYYEK